MPKAMQLPTLRKGESVETPVVRKAKNPQLSHVKIVGQGKVKKQSIDLVPAGKKKVAETTSTNGTIPVRSGMRTAEIALLEGFMGRIELVDLRGRKAKPAIQITKGEYDALNLGMDILRSTVRVKK